MDQEDKHLRQHSEGEEIISRKEAILKAGKFAAFTAAAMMLILDPSHSMAQPPKSKPKPPRPRSQPKKATRKDPPPSY
jgi:hypothetical protein